MAEIDPAVTKFIAFRTWTPPPLVRQRYELEQYGHVLKVHRDYAELSMRALADEVGIRQDVISRIEHGQWMPSREEEHTLAVWMMQQA